MFERFTNRAQEVIGEAKKAAAQLEQNYIGTEHLLLGLVRVSDSVASKLLQEQGVTEERLEELISSLITPTGSVSVREPDGFSPEAYRVIQSSYLEAKRFHSSLVGTEHILISMLKSFDCAGTKLLNTMKVNIRQLYIELVSAKDGDVAAAREDVESLQYTRNAESKTPLLDQYSTDLTELAKEGRIDPVIGREQEINRVIQILSRRTKNNPCLIGEPGVGKTAIAEGLASRIYEGNVPDTISGKRVVTLDMAGMVAGSKYRGEFEERMKNVINEVRNDGQTLLFIDELHTLVDAGGADGAMNASNILKPCLARGELQIVGATTIDEYRKHIEKDAALERRFQPVKVEEPTAEEAIQILRGLKGRYEEHHHVTITDEAVVAAVKLSKRYINDRFLPDKAIDLIDEASSKTRLDAYVMPDEIKTLEAQIEQLTKDKEEAIKSEAYEQAGEIKKKQLKKKEQLEKMTKQWQDSINENNLIVDEDVFRSEYFGCHPCINTSSLRIKTKDVFEKVLPELGVEYRTVSV